MKNKKEITIRSIKYRDDQKAKENLVEFILNYILYQNLLEKEDSSGRKL